MVGFILLAPAAALGIGLLLRHLIQTYRPDSWRRRFVIMRESGSLFLWSAVITPVVFLFLVWLFVARSNGSAIVRLLTVMPTACVLAGLQIFMLAHRPTGKFVRCSKCTYDLTGLSAESIHGAGSLHDARCPECGGYWGWPGGTERIKKAWNVKWVAVGMLLFLPLVGMLGSWPIMGVGWWNRVTLKMVPTSSLIQEVLTSRSLTVDAWAELSKRQISTKDTARIAEQLLSRPPVARFSHDEISWLTDAMSARAIDAKLIEPYMKSMFKATAQREGTIGGVLVVLKPDVLQFGPFQDLDVSVEVLAHGRDKQLPPVLVRGAGSDLYTAYSFGPFHGPSGTSADRFGGTMNILLVARRPPGSAVGGAGLVVPSGEYFYKVDVPIDVPVDKVK